MTHPILQEYAKLVPFLGKALGPYYEVALHDLSDENKSIIAIANNHISGREIGAPPTNVALQIIHDKTYETKDWELHYNGLSVEGKKLRSSNYFIKDNDELIGMMCITFDDSKFQSICQDILALCHPDEFIKENILPQDSTVAAWAARDIPPKAEMLYKSVDEVVKDAIQTQLSEMNVPADRLTQEERLKIISALEESGVFSMKGAVKEVANMLCCSVASVYRYLSQVKK